MRGRDRGSIGSLMSHIIVVLALYLIVIWTFYLHDIHFWRTQALK